MPKKTPDVKKVVLAYSGGLDTSVILRWLQDTYHCEVVTFTADLWRGGFSLLGYGSHNRAAGEKALRLIEEGRLNLAPLITHTMPFTRYAEGVGLLRTRQAVKILFDPWL